MAQEQELGRQAAAAAVRAAEVAAVELAAGRQQAVDQVGARWLWNLCLDNLHTPSTP